MLRSSISVSVYLPQYLEDPQIPWSPDFVPFDESERVMCRCVQSERYVWRVFIIQIFRVRKLLKFLARTQLRINSSSMTILGTGWAGILFHWTELLISPALATAPAVAGSPATFRGEPFRAAALTPAPKPSME